MLPMASASAVSNLSQAAAALSKSAAQPIFSRLCGSGEGRRFAEIAQCPFKRMGRQPQLHGVPRNDSRSNRRCQPRTFLQRGFDHDTQNVRAADTFQCVPPIDRARRRVLAGCRFHSSVASPRRVIVRLSKRCRCHDCKIIGLNCNESLMVPLETRYSRPCWSSGFSRPGEHESRKAELQHGHYLKAELQHNALPSRFNIWELELRVFEKPATGPLIRVLA